MATVYSGDRPRIYPKTERVEAALDFLREQLPTGEIGSAPQPSDDSLVLVNLSRDVDPGTTYLFNWDEMTVSELYRSRPELPIDYMVEMQPIRYLARDGLEIPAYLSLPRSFEGEKPPLVALIHGGPWARDGWGYRSQVQFLANRGYAVLQPNFRGSTGYGKAFLNAGNQEWGDAMQDDITDGVHWLIEQGIAELREQGMQALVLDLRGNPGGVGMMVVLQRRCCSVFSFLHPPAFLPVPVRT